IACTRDIAPAIDSAGCRIGFRRQRSQIAHRRGVQERMRRDAVSQVRRSNHPTQVVNSGCLAVVAPQGTDRTHRTLAPFEGIGLDVARERGEANDFISIADGVRGTEASPERPQIRYCVKLSLAGRCQGNHQRDHQQIESLHYLLSSSGAFKNYRQFAKLDLMSRTTLALKTRTSCGIQRASSVCLTPRR